MCNTTCQQTEAGHLLTILELPLQNPHAFLKARNLSHLTHGAAERNRLAGRVVTYMQVITQRTGKGIWQNMYEFPLIETKSEQIPSELIGKSVFSSEVQKHILSHQHIFAVNEYLHGP